MPEPVRGNLQLTDIVAGDKLRTGDIISARIQTVLPDGRFRLLWNGRTLTARSHLNFRPGQIIRARVERNSGGFFLLLRDSRSKIPHTASPQASTRTLLSAALLRAGLSLPDGSEAARRAALLKHTKGHRVRMARLYAELLSKGTDPTADFLESVDTALSGDGRDHRSGNWTRPPDSDELKDEMNEEGDDPDSLINLLNNVSGHRDHWMFRRLVRHLGEGEIRMVWKIRRGMDPALALTIYDGSRTFEFLMEGLDNTQLSVFTDDNTEIDTKKWKSFRESLALMNVEVDDTILSIAESDGFTPGTGKAVRDLEERE
ncbi:MAG: hypothetical protein KAJ98_09645 [Spirochaetaceae bacterium]|nr:hypothetical protein [Spirochaetaceae bacterium]